MTYDGNGNVSSRTDFNGNKACYDYNLSRSLETARVEGVLASEDCARCWPPRRIVPTCARYDDLARDLSLAGDAH